MALLYGAKFIHPGTDEANPHLFGYNVARVTANSLLLDIWNGSTSAGRKAAVDLNGKFYSAALTAGDMLYAVAGSVAGVKRLDSLAIGTANQLLRVNAGATAPEWASTLAGLTLTAPTINAVTITGIITGTPTWASTQAMNVTGNVTGNVSGSSGSCTGLAATATALATPRAINGVAFDGTAAITVTAAAGTLSGATLAAGVTASSLTSVGVLTAVSVSGAITMTAAASQIIPGATSWAVRNNANSLNNLILTNTGILTIAVDVVVGRDVCIPALRSLRLNTTGDPASIGYATGPSSGRMALIGGSQGIEFIDDDATTIRVFIPSTGGFVIGSAALATNATDGFLNIPTCAGTPTGAPLAFTGTAAFVYDTTNDKLYVYRGGWKATAALT